MPDPVTTRRALLAGLMALGTTCASSADASHRRPRKRLIRARSRTLQTPDTNRLIVENNRQLASALRIAKPGTLILLKPGEYHGPLNVFNLRGTNDLPIRLEAVRPKAARISGTTHLSPKSSNIHFANLDLDGATFIVSGSGHRFTNCYIRPTPNIIGRSFSILLKYGSDLLVEDCELALYMTDEVVKLFGKTWRKKTSYGVIRGYFSKRRNQWFENVTIRRCRLTGGPAGVPYSAPNCQFIEADSNPAEWKNEVLNWKIEDIVGEVERQFTVIDIKAPGVILRNAKISSKRNCSIQLRDSHSQVIENVDFSGTITVSRGPGKEITNSRFKSCRIMAGDVPWNVFRKKHDIGQAYEVQIEGCSGNLIVGHQYRSHKQIYPALNTTVREHRGAIELRAAKGTSIK